jgi:predicted negative regulator of RcsB-dependent stress response
MNRNALYAIIGVLIVAAGVLGYQWYAERQKTDRVEIDVGKNGLSIEKK